MQVVGRHRGSVHGAAHARTAGCARQVVFSGMPNDRASCRCRWHDASAVVLPISPLAAIWTTRRHHRSQRVHALLDGPPHLGLGASAWRPRARSPAGRRPQPRDHTTRRCAARGDLSGACSTAYLVMGVWPRPRGAPHDARLRRATADSSVQSVLASSGDRPPRLRRRSPARRSMIEAIRSRTSSGMKTGVAGRASSRRSGRESRRPRRPGSASAPRATLDHDPTGRKRSWLADQANRHEEGEPKQDEVDDELRCLASFRLPHRGGDRQRIATVRGIAQAASAAPARNSGTRLRISEAILRASFGPVRAEEGPICQIHNGSRAGCRRRRRLELPPRTAG